METEFLVSIVQHNCKHENHRKYRLRSFDIFNGFEISATKCSNCHKTAELSVRKVSTHEALKAKSMNRARLLNYLGKKRQLILSWLKHIDSVFSPRFQETRD